MKKNHVICQNKAQKRMHKNAKRISGLVLALFLVVGLGSITLISCERKPEQTTIIKEVPKDDPSGVQVEIHSKDSGVEIKGNAGDGK